MKIFEGIVVSVGMEKTAIVSVERQTVHPLYKKRLKRQKKYKVDTGDTTVVLGSRVKIIETKPLSKQKHFKIMEIVKEKTK